MEYNIFDGNGRQLPDMISGKKRNLEQAKKMVGGLNRNGEFPPYVIKEIK